MHSDEFNIGDIVYVIPPDQLQPFEYGSYPFRSGLETDNPCHYYILDSTLDDASKRGAFIITEKYNKYDYCDYCIKPCDGKFSRSEGLSFHESMLSPACPQFECDFVDDQSLNDFIGCFVKES